MLGGQLKGAGVDCATLLGLYLIEIGAAPADLFKGLSAYSHDWFLHDANERYLRRLVRFGFQAADGLCRADARAQPGDIVLFRVMNARVFNHGAIVTAWPYAVHAEARGVCEVNLTAHQLTYFFFFFFFFFFYIVLFQLINQILTTRHCDRVALCGSRRGARGLRSQPDGAPAYSL